MPSKKEWRKDFNRSILEGGAHWKRRPPTKFSEEQFYKECLSFNTLINLFDEDKEANKPEDRQIDESKTTFGAYYEGYSLAQMLRKFHDRLDTLESYDPADTGRRDPDKDAERFPIADLNNAKQHMLDAANLAADPALNDIKMKDLYLDTFYDLDLEIKTKLETILDKLNCFRETLQWICMPFLDFKRNRDDAVGVARPPLSALNAHLRGWNNTDPIPTLPNGSEITKSMLRLDDKSMREFLFFNQPGDKETDWHYEARNFAAEWHFFDSIGVTSRRALILGQPTDVVITSSGNGYKCDGVSCKPSNASSFCVSTSCP